VEGCRIFVPIRGESNCEIRLMAPNIDTYNQTICDVVVRRRLKVDFLVPSLTSPSSFILPWLCCICVFFSDSTICCIRGFCCCSSKESHSTMKCSMGSFSIIAYENCAPLLQFELSVSSTLGRLLLFLLSAFTLSWWVQSVSSFSFVVLALLFFLIFYP